MVLFRRRPASVVSMPPAVSSANLFADDIPPASAIKPPRGSISSAITRKLSVTGSIRSQSVKSGGGWRAKLRTLQFKVSSHGMQNVPGIPEEADQALSTSLPSPFRLRSRLSTRLSVRRSAPASSPVPSQLITPHQVRPPAPPPYFYPRPFAIDYWEEVSDENTGLNDRLYAQLHRVLADQRYREQRRSERRRLQDLKTAAGLEQSSLSVSPVSSEAVSITSLEIRKWLSPTLPSTTVDSPSVTTDMLNVDHQLSSSDATIASPSYRFPLLFEAPVNPCTPTPQERKRSVDLSNWSWSTPGKTLKDYALDIRPSIAMSSGTPSVSSLFEWDDSDVEDDESDYTPPVEATEGALGGEFWMNLLNKQVDDGLRLSGMRVGSPTQTAGGELYTSQVEVKSRCGSVPSETSDVFAELKSAAWPMPPRRQKSDDGSWGLAKKSLGSMITHQRSYSMIPSSTVSSDCILTPPDSAKTIRASALPMYSPPPSPPLSPTPSRTVNTL